MSLVYIVYYIRCMLFLAIGLFSETLHKVVYLTVLTLFYLRSRILFTN